MHRYVFEMVEIVFNNFCSGEEMNKLRGIFRGLVEFAFAGGSS
jgi:hypothetical protein